MKNSYGRYVDWTGYSSSCYIFDSVTFTIKGLLNDVQLRNQPAGKIRKP